MKKPFLLLVCLLLYAAAIVETACAQLPVSKTNPMKVYMHYMPWFETPATIGKWGWHWTMNNQNPNIIGTNGQRQIASHYYPLIGPYASRDKDVIEYHMLLLKLSGVDGLLINWYGVAGSNGDISDLLKSSDSIVSYTDDFGMKFGVVMEDRFSRSIDDVKSNMAYLGNNYFNKPEYIRVGTGNDPLVCIFGPITFQTPADWTNILPSAGEDIEFLTLWNESGEAGSNADGEFAWVYQTSQKNHIVFLDDFYSTRAPQLKTSAGSAYPGFDDFYAEGNAGAGYFTIPSYYGSTLDATFNKIDEYKTNLDMVQLITFNDFGEGTMFEPTVETNFDYLKRLQLYTGVPYGESELKLVYRLYRLRKDYQDDPDVQAELNKASVHLRNLEIPEAAAILNIIALKTNLSGKKTHQLNDLGFLLFPNPNKGGTLNIAFEREIQRPAHLSITDISGKIEFEVTIEKGSSLFSTSDLQLNKGIYFLTLSNEGYLKTLKFIVAE